MTVGVALKFVAFVRARASPAARKKQEILDHMASATQYDAWSQLGSELDRLCVQHPELLSSPMQQPTDIFSPRLLEEALTEFARLRKAGDVHGLMSCLRAELNRDFGHMTKSAVTNNRHVLPAPIGDYINAVIDHLDYICEYRGEALSQHAKISYFKETRHTFGRTALVLSGGGALGSFHLGVVRALLEQGLLPRIVAGSSVGAIVAAIAGMHTDVELRHLFGTLNTFSLCFFKHATPLQSFLHMLNRGSLQDEGFLMARLRELLGDVTFSEAHARSGRILNVTITPCDTNEPPRMLNYLTAPNLLVWSAVTASSAFPGLFPAHELLCKARNGSLEKFAPRGAGSSQRRWHDGSLENDLPFRHLSEMFTVNHTIVSQTNPHLVPLMSLRHVLPGRLAMFLESEVKHCMRQAQLYCPSWVPTKWMRLFTQPWEGDVTILMPFSLYNKYVGKAIYNPSTQDLLECSEAGRHATWQRMAAIEGNTAIELKLDQCQRKAEADARPGRGGSRGALEVEPPGASAPGMRARLPSWLFTPSSLRVSELDGVCDDREPHARQAPSEGVPLSARALSAAGARAGYYGIGHSRSRASLSSDSMQHVASSGSLAHVGSPPGGGWGARERRWSGQGSELGVDGPDGVAPGRQYRRVAAPARAVVPGLREEWAGNDCTDVSVDTSAEALGDSRRAATEDGYSMDVVAP